MTQKEYYLTVTDDQAQTLASLLACVGGLGESRDQANALLQTLMKIGFQPNENDVRKHPLAPIHSKTPSIWLMDRHNPVRSEIDYENVKKISEN